MTTESKVPLEDIESRIAVFHDTFDPALKIICGAARTEGWQVRRNEEAHIAFSDLMMLIPNAVGISPSLTGRNNHSEPNKDIAMQYVPKESSNGGYLYDKESYLTFVEQKLTPVAEQAAIRVAQKPENKGKNLQDLSKRDQDVIVAYQQLRTVMQEWKKDDYLKSLLIDVVQAHVEHVHEIITDNALPRLLSQAKTLQTQRGGRG